MAAPICPDPSVSCLPALEIDGAASVLIDALGALDTCVPCPCAVVELRIDGRRWFVLFDVDAAEHDRRNAEGVAAASSTGLLHALWELPEGLPVAFGDLGDRDVTTLSVGGAGFVDVIASGFVRTFRPAGSIRVLAAVSRRLKGAVRQIAQHPPIYRRLAVSTQGGAHDDVDSAERFGIGTVLATRDGPVVVTPMSGSELGVPAVYRWWLSELAYRNWLYPPYKAAHWTSCAFGSS